MSVERDAVLCWMLNVAEPVWDEDDPQYLRATRALDALLRQQAHELAEQQRAYAREVGIPLEDGDIVYAGDVIDLIDPQLGAGPVRPDEEPTP